MMKTTRFIQWSALFLAGAMMASCSSDDEKVVEPEVKNAFTYEGKEYELKSGYIYDEGEWDPLEDVGEYEPSHYLYEFQVNNGNYEKDEYGYYRATDAEYDIYLGLLYPNLTAWEEGEFTYVDEETGTEEVKEDIKDKLIFTNASLWFDQNGDGMINWATDDFIDAVGGTVKVTGSDRNYTLVYELQLENGKTVKGAFSGDFTIEKDQ